MAGGWGKTTFKSARLCSSFAASPIEIQLIDEHAKVERKYPLEKQNDHIVPIEEIETTHLRLRRPTTADTLILGDLWRNEQVRQFLGGVVSQDVIEGKIASLREHWNEYGFGQWAIS